MADQDKGATQPGASVVEGDGQEGNNGALTPRHPERESEMDRIAARRMAELTGKPAEEPAAAAESPAAAEPAQEPEKTANQAAEPAAAASDTGTLSLAEQIAKQLDAGTLVLTEEILSKAVVTTKVDGNEEMVPAVKALGQYQKGAAADVRLAEATRVSKEAADLLKKAQETSAAATTAATAKAAEEKQVEANAEFQRLTKEHTAAVFSGDDEKAAELLGQLIDLKTAGRASSATPTPGPTVDEVVKQAVPAVQQRLDVDRALTQLKTDYPEIWSDPHYALLADHQREAHEAQGKSRAEAITLAGEDIGKKFGIGKFKKTDVPPSGGATTLTQKLAAKEGLDEPQSAATRAPTNAALPQSHSAIIAEMAQQRAPRPRSA